MKGELLAMGYQVTIIMSFQLKTIIKTYVLTVL